MGNMFDCCLNKKEKITDQEHERYMLTVISTKLNNGRSPNLYPRRVFTCLKLITRDKDLPPKPLLELELEDILDQLDHNHFWLPPLADPDS